MMHATLQVYFITEVRNGWDLLTASKQGGHSVCVLSGLNMNKLAKRRNAEGGVNAGLIGSD